MKDRRTKKEGHVQHVMQASVGICAMCCTEKEGCLQVLEGDSLMTIFNSMKNMVDAHKFQLRGLVMVQNISKIPEGA